MDKYKIDIRSQEFNYDNYIDAQNKARELVGTGLWFVNLTGKGEEDKNQITDKKIKINNFIKKAYNLEQKYSKKHNKTIKILKELMELREIKVKEK